MRRTLHVPPWRLRRLTLVGALATVCNGCGAGHLSSTWSYTPQLNNPLGPGTYQFVAQAFDISFKGGPGSKNANITIG